MKTKFKFIVPTILVILICIFGVSYAFFEYYRVGANHQLIVGNIYLDFNEKTDSINLSNVFPETVEKARSRTDNFITFTVSGLNTTTDNDISYEIFLNNGTIENGKIRANPQDLVFDLTEINEDGTETFLISAMSYTYIDERGIWVENIQHGTIIEDNKTYKLRMWLSENVIISDTLEDANYTTSDFAKSYASVKVSVYGDFTEKPTYNYMARLGTSSSTFWPSEINSVMSSKITSVSFVSMNQETINEQYDAATIKADLSHITDSGEVKAWLENGEVVTNSNGTETQYYIMYIASDGMVVFPNDCSYMFNGFSNLESLSFENINTENVTNMSYMFNFCKLISLDLSDFNTGNVTNMSYMFYNCSRLKSLDLGDFDTGNVTNMSYMFMFCENLTSLDISNFNTGNVTNMSYMFMFCRNLTSLDVSNFNTGNVTNMSYMFMFCQNLTSLDVSNFDTSKVTNMGSMFCNCSNLATIYANTDWNTPNITYSNGMFGGSSNLVGVIAYDYSKTDVTYANPTTGYFTKKTA